jgi:hypothetical protein
VTETPPPPRDDDPAGDDPWFHPTPPEEHAAAHAITAAEPEPVAGAVEPEPAPGPAVTPRTRRETATDLAADAAPAGIVLALFAIAALIVPTMTQVATTDDWGYTRSVEILLDEGTLKVFPVVAATAVGQVLWGAMFGAVFGMSLGMMRVSTVVMVAIGAVALYAILRQLGVSRGRGAIGMAVWLFNPLTFSLAFSFMTDAHFASAMLIAVALYVRGLRPDREDVRWIVAGSVAAAFAFLIRQQGALIPFAVGMYLVATGRLWFRRGDLRRLLAVAAVPAVTVIAYYAWLRWLNDVPNVQEDFLDEAREAGWEGTWLLIRRIPVYAAFYAGLLLIPILVAIAPWRRKRETPRPISGFMVYLGAGWVTVIVAALYLAGRRDHQMPFVPQFVGLGGLGPPDVLGSRPRLVPVGGWETAALTIAAAIGAIVLGGVVIRALGGRRDPAWAGFWLVMVVGLWQLIGILPPSYHYLNRGVTLDRYLLPVIPIAIVAALWAVRDVDLMQPVSWTLLAVVAAFSIAGARDYLVFLDNVWEMAEYANENGVEDDRLDAGSAWDGYRLYTVMLDENVTKARSPRGSPWWVYFYAKPTDSSYIVATRANVRSGYFVAASDEYDLWLDDDPGKVYLLRRWYLPFPVTGDDAGSTGVVIPIARPGPTPTPAATPGASPAPSTPVILPAPATPMS